MIKVHSTLMAAGNGRADFEYTFTDLRKTHNQGRIRVLLAGYAALP